VLSLCASFQAAVRLAGGDQALGASAEVRLRAARDAAVQLAALARRSHALHRHRQALLEAVIVALLEPSCVGLVLEHFAFCVFPAALLLLGRLRSGSCALGATASLNALSHLAHDPCLEAPVLELVRCPPPGLLAAPHSPAEARLLSEALLRLLVAQAPKLRSCLDLQQLTELLQSSDPDAKQLAVATLAQIAGIGVVDQPSAPSTTDRRPTLLDRARQVEAATAAVFLDCSGGGDLDDEMRPEQSAEASRASENWDETAEGVRCRHGVCFQVIDSSIKEQMPFVSSEPAAEAMRELLLAIGMGSPVLVTGPSGVGKTTFLRRAAELMGQHEPVFLFCDEQTDIKMLLGTYVCGETVGEFIWRPGIVTEALQKGRWLVLEDVDRIPAEVLAALLPLTDSRRLVIPDRNQRIDAHQHFQLFGTLSSSGQTVLWRPVSKIDAATAEDVDNTPMAGEDGAVEAAAEEMAPEAGRGRIPPLVSAWTRVWLAPLQESHLASMLIGLYKELAPLQDRLLASAATLREAALEAGPLAAASGAGPATGPRDLLRWCSRLRQASLVLSPTFTEESRTVLLREALQTLLGRVADTRLRRSLLARLAPIWSLETGVADALLQERPTITFLPLTREVLVGSVSLPLGTTCEDADPTSRCAPFAYTSVHARVLQALASAIRNDEPALLVGDTGTGKTSVVQHIGQMLGQEVLVYNFNEQSESTELIGGFRPVDAVMQVMSDLVEAFAAAFEQTFSRRKNAKLLEKVRGLFIARRWTGLLEAVGKTLEDALRSLGDSVAQASRGVKATHLTRDWEKIRQLHRAATALGLKGSAPKFEFQEGLLVKALRSGAWVVLDEINLAPGDMLQRIQGLVERSPGMHLALPESGDEMILPHPNFRIFACMNPPRLPLPPDAEGDFSTNADGISPADEASLAGARSGASAGKKELPPGIRGRFTEIWVDEVHTADDLGRVVRSYLERDLPSPPVDAIVGFYKKATLLCRQSALLDGAGRVSYFSLRNLTRALRFALRLARRPVHATPAKHALAQGLAVGFATTLDTSSAKVVEDLIKEALGVDPTVRRTGGGSSSSKGVASATEASTASVQVDKEKGWLNVEGYWIKAGPQEIDSEKAHQDFVITPSVRRNLHNISRMLSGGRSPLLLEGPTSSGKTSLVKFLAQLTGHEFVRINNHEHTDLQEYVGQYVCDPETGQLVFQEGVLVRAARAGHWVVLDELNLAPSEVLEALNRLLDDNRELYIPDTGITVKPHEEFMVFATQNPAGGTYGGRKLLSRAFRNRFTEIFVQELPMEELGVVLHKRCAVPPSYVKSMLGVYSDLQSHRNQSAVFLGKQSFMTVRDLLRWGHRSPQSHQELAVEGFTLLAERLRKEEDREVVRTSLQKHCTGVKDLHLDYTQDAVVKDARDRVAAKLEAGEVPPGGVGSVVWTPAFCRMVALVGRCVRSGEPALLVGETGGGKTMACQLLSWALVENGNLERRLRTLNCHQQTETADFIGSLRPVRGRDTTFSAICAAATELQARLGEALEGNNGAADGLAPLRHELGLASQGGGSPKVLGQTLRIAIARWPQQFAAGSGAEQSCSVTPADSSSALSTTASQEGQTSDEPQPSTKRRRTAVSDGVSSACDTAVLARQLLVLCASYDRIFEWADGALVEAMRLGGAFLVDEISLAEDSVLERLNSVLEPGHSLLMAEKPLSGTDLEEVRALPSFRLFATMNPGGDFGKRELSPALRNRFTEIWVEPIDFATSEAEDLVASQLSWPVLARPMLDSVIWFNKRVLHPLSIREVLGWSAFVSGTAPSGQAEGLTRAVEMYLHGGCMTLVDSLGLGNQLVDTECIAAAQLRQKHASEDDNGGGLTLAQKAVLFHLVGQLDGPGLQALLGDDAQAIRAAFSMGGFAWVRRQLAPPAKDGTLDFGGFKIQAVPTSTDVDMDGQFRLRGTLNGVQRGSKTQTLLSPDSNTRPGGYSRFGSMPPRLCGDGPSRRSLAESVTQLMAQRRWNAGQESLNNVMPDKKHFRESATPHPLRPHQHLDPDEGPIVELMHNHVWSQEEIDLRLGNLYQHKPQSWSDSLARGIMYSLYRTFNFMTGFKPVNTPVKAVEWRLIVLESFAGVPGFMVAMFRHFRSLRTLERDHGWIHTLLEEAENERMHLLVCMKMFKAGPITRFLVVAAQLFMTPMLAMVYIARPKAVHRFVGYLEETACMTYANIIHQVETPGTPLHEAWAELPAPALAKAYWKLSDEALVWPNHVIQIVEMTCITVAFHELMARTICSTLALYINM
ncbi:unnamed protein product, partial [Polarella glacialis]